MRAQKFKEFLLSAQTMKKSSQELKEIIDEIYALAEKERDSLVVVEGKRDAKAIKELGFYKIVTLNKPLYEVAEGINEKRVLLLTDLDKKGKQIYAKLKKDLDKRGISIDNNLRNLLFKTELRQIEGLTNYLRRFKE
jgi:5S rRNA maturation endonuclease (ribonuclease M5)